jgi:hypothetical protein
MDQKQIRSRLGKLFEEKIRVGNHQVCLQRQARDSPERLHNRSSESDVGNEMSVHYIDVNPIGSRLLGFGHLLTQARKVGGENRRSELDNTVHISL